MSEETLQMDPRATVLQRWRQGLRSQVQQRVKNASAASAATQNNVKMTKTMMTTAQISRIPPRQGISKKATYDLHAHTTKEVRRSTNLGHVPDLDGQLSIE